MRWCEVSYDVVHGGEDAFAAHRPAEREVERAVAIDLAVHLKERHIQVEREPENDVADVREKIVERYVPRADGVVTQLIVCTHNTTHTTG